MGYALFASRKLMLTNSINMLNLELTDIMNKRMDLTELGSAVSDGEITSADIAGCKQAGLACEYGLDMYSTKITKAGDPEYQAGLISAEKEARQNVGLSWGANIGGAAAGAAAGFAIGGPIGALIGGIGGAIIGNKCSKKTQARDEYVNDYKEQYEANKKEQMARDIQEQIAKMENQLEKRQKTIETKIQAYQSDLEATEKAEATAIKNATPKYSGVQ